ncbi:MAG: CDP-archaeol synthase [archaeon]
MDLLTLIMGTLYLLLPGAVANTMPILFKHSLKMLALPVDGGARLLGHRVFGSHKTWRGILVGVAGGTLMAGVQGLLHGQGTLVSISLVDYSAMPVLIFGFLFSIGIMVGDLVESMIKRQVGKKPGQRWFPFDQIDSAIGGLIFILPMYQPPVAVIITGLVLSIILHVGFRHIGYYLGINKKRW